MRRWACVAVLAVIFILIAFPCFGFQNEPDGFRGIKWGELFVDRKDLDPVNMPPYDDNEVERHMKLAPEPPLGDVELQQVRYEFWRGKFIGAYANIWDKSNLRKVQMICEERFGLPSRISVSHDKFEWKGDRTTILLVLDEVAEVGLLSFSSTQIRKEQDKQKRKRSREAGEKGF